MKRFIIGLVLVLTSNLFAEPTPFAFQDGDRVALVGGTFIEQEQEDGYIEATLTAAALGKKITFRNLGWSGDTVESHLNPTVPARPKYVPNLFSYLEQVKPTVIFVNYGGMESFRGETGLAAFIKTYGELLDKLSQTTKRIVLISPARHEQLRGRWPDPAEHNRNLQLYVGAMEKLAKERGLPFVNLFMALPVAPEVKDPITHNGVHFTPEGYLAAGEAIRKALGLPKAKVRPADFEKLRAAIQHKNKQWWFHYKPMNSEYVYPGGTRYQNELGGITHPMFSEIEAFARLADKEDEAIAAMCQQLAAGQEAKAERPQHPVKIVPRESKVPDPAEEQKTFQVAEGFEVNLFAADPLIAKPVQMAFNLKNRLWVATTTLYPQIQPGEEPSDKIIILEDADGDGRAEKTTVFAEGLVIPTGVLPYGDGAYVADDTTLLFLRDTDGDGRADKKEIILSGFGTEDSHHKVHTLRWDPIGRIHFNVGVFLHNNIETPHGLVSHSGHWNAGIFAYHPPTGKLDVYLANSVPPNPWGHYWNRWGFDFHIDSSGQQGSNFILPTSEKTSSAIPIAGGEGKLAGAEIVNGRHLPDDWQGNLIAPPFKENRVGRWQFSDDSSGYSMKAMPSVIVSTDSAFRPVDQRIGPDGAIYIADWYNPLIGHMQHHFRDPGRDFTHGRIWRVTAKGRPLVPRPVFEGASVWQLLDHLKAPEDYTRAQARLALAQRDQEDVLSELKVWVDALDANDPDYDHHRVEAVWVCQTFGVVHPTLLMSLTRAKDPNARAAAAVAFRNYTGRFELKMNALEALVQDEHPRVRLQAVITLSHVPHPASMALAAKVLDKPMDRYLEQALKNTAIALKPHWESQLSEATLFGGNAKHLEFVLTAAGAQANPKTVLALLRAGKLSGESFEAGMRTLAQSADLKDLEVLYRQDLSPEQQPRAIAVLTQAARERKMIPSDKWHKRLEHWLAQPDEATRCEAMRLAGAWKVERVRSQLENALQAGGSEKIRTAAGDAIAGLGGGKSVDFLKSLTAANDRITGNAALAALIELDAKAAATQGARLLRSNLDNQEIARIMEVFLRRNNGAELLGGELAKSKITSDNAKVALRTMQLAGRQDKPLLDVLNAAAGISAEPRQLSRSEMDAIVTEVRSKGDAHRGERIFRRPELACFQCHAIASAGGILGPDLSAVGSGSQLDYLVESLLDPNKIIKDGYESVEVTTRDDEYVLGIKVRENPNELVLKDATRDEIVIGTAQIHDKKNRQTSLMPPGLTAGLTHAEFLDLCRFLSELGKPGPFANNPQPIVRRWQTAASAGDGATDPAWNPVYSLVSGLLPLEALAGNGNQAMARCQFRVTTGGQIKLKVNSTEGLSLSIDRQSVDLKEITTVELQPGLYSAVFRVDLTIRKEGLRVELEQPADSTGRFQLVTGK